MILGWFALRVSLQGRFNPLKSSFTEARRKLSGKQRAMFSEENYTVAVVKELKIKVAELGLSSRAIRWEHMSGPQDIIRMPSSRINC